MARRVHFWLFGIAVAGFLAAGCRTTGLPDGCCVLPQSLHQEPAARDPLVRQLLDEENARTNQYGNLPRAKNYQKAPISSRPADFTTPPLWTKEQSPTGVMDLPDAIEQEKTPAGTASHYPILPDVAGATKSVLPEYSKFPPEGTALQNLPDVTEPISTKVPEKREPLLLALEKFLQDQPEDAIQHLRDYHPNTQDVFLRLLPVLAQMTHKKLDQFSAEENAKLYEQLDCLMLAMRARTDLVIDKMCFCETVEPNGLHKPLADGHIFRAKDGQQLGELVQVFVQLRNLNMEKHGRFFEAKLSSSVEIVDATGGKEKRLWFYDFEDSDRPLRSQTNRQDHFNNYSFYVPHLPPGTYTLRVQVRDLTRPDHPRNASKTLAFAVGR